MCVCCSDLFPIFSQCASHLNLGWKIQVVDKDTPDTDTPVPTTPDTDTPVPTTPDTGNLEDATRASFLLLLLGLCIMFLLQ